MLSVPITKFDVTEEWVAKTLQLALNKNGGECSKVIVKHFKASKPLEFGMLSAVFQANCESHAKDGLTKNYRLFIKIMPQDLEHREFFAGNTLDVTEIESYDKLLKDMITFEDLRFGDAAKLQAMIPKVFASGYTIDPEKPRGFFLMLEDLSSRFKMPPTEEGNIDMI